MWQAIVCPLGHTFDMVVHNPSMLKIPARLLAPNQVKPISGANLGHREDKKLCPPCHFGLGNDSAGLSPGADTSKLSNAIHNS